jgi:hypothetical protein
MFVAWFHFVNEKGESSDPIANFNPALTVAGFPE